LRLRLDEICHQELEGFRQEAGPFSEEQEQKLEALAGRITQRLAGTLARELKELPEQVEQERMTAAVQRLFHLPQRVTAAAGTNS
jgi:glutamyl-tRNA reductase